MTSVPKETFTTTSALTLSDDVFGCVRRCHWTHNKYVKDSLTPTGWSFVSCAAMMMRQVNIRFVFEIEFLREHFVLPVLCLFYALPFLATLFHDSPPCPSIRHF
jgi:hypothetical protein